MHPLSYNAAAWHAVSQNQPWWNTRQRGREICALCMSARLLQSITCSILDQRSLLRFSGDGFEASGKGGCWRSQEPEGKLGSSQAAGEDHQVEGQVNGRQQGFWPSSGEFIICHGQQAGVWWVAKVPPSWHWRPGRGLERGLTQASWHYLALVKQLSRPGGRYLLLLPLSIHLDVKTFMSSFHLNILQRLIGENPKTFVAVNL